MRGLILGVAWLAAATTAAAAPASPTVVSELVVKPEAKCLPAKKNPAAPAPRIVSTFPANHAVIRPGRLVLRITFDRPMTCRGFLVDNPPLKSPCPRSRQELVLSFDRRTVRLLCATSANTAYALRLGDGGLHSFVSLDGHPAPYGELTFSTSGGPRVETVTEALGEDR